MSTLEELVKMPERIFIVSITETNPFEKSINYPVNLFLTERDAWECIDILSKQKINQILRYNCKVTDSYFDVNNGFSIEYKPISNEIINPEIIRYHITELIFPYGYRNLGITIQNRKEYIE